MAEIVTTLIIILLALVAIGIVWIVISNILSQGSQQTGLEQFSIDINFIRASVNENNVTLTVKRSIGAGNLTGIKFIISDGFNSEEFTKTESLAELQEKTFVVTLVSLNSSNIKTVSVVPIFDRNSEDVLGDITDTYTFTSASSGGQETEPELECNPLCDSGQICNNGVCISSEGCSELRTDLQVCNDKGASCGVIQDICGDFINCDVATGGCSSEKICNHGICILEGCSELRTDLQVCNDEEISCGVVQDICGEFINCNVATGGCDSGQICNNGVCTSTECAEPRTDIEICNNQGVACGQVQDICGDFINCDVATGGCSSEEICNNGKCILKGCTDERTDLQVCTDEEASCGVVQDVCGDFVNCNTAPGGCSEIEQCILHLCQPLTPITGTVDSVWPAGIAIYFDSYDLPNDNVYSGYYVKFLPPSQETECLLVDDYNLPQPPQAKVIIRLQAVQTGVASNDDVQLWPNFASCEAY